MALPDCTWIVQDVLAGTVIASSASRPDTSEIGLTRQSWALSTLATAMATTQAIDRPTNADAEMAGRASANSPRSSERRTRAAICAAGAACRELTRFMSCDQPGSRADD